MPRPLPRELLAAATPDATTDGDLLRRYVRDGDAAAFELVVRRHAAAVWAACRRILPEADAEDAFQAAFLVLVRKAGAVRGSCAGGWLHRVAVTAALKRKASADRAPVSRGRETPEFAPADFLERAELAAAIHEELARLPERYRLPVVLCDLEGETQTAAASRLGWPVGSVAGRLSRARALLRDRLTRRGFAPAGSVLVLPYAVVPGRVLTAAVATARGVTAPTLPVSVLASGVLTAMRTTKLKLTVAAVAAVGLFGAAGFGAFTVTSFPAATVQTSEKGDPAPPPEPPTADWLAVRNRSPSAFPDIKSGDIGRIADFPELFGKESVRIVPEDDTYQRLLKARLHRLRSLLQQSCEAQEPSRPARVGSLAPFAQLGEEVRTVVTELHSRNPRLLDAWLTDLIRLAKTVENVSMSRFDTGGSTYAEFSVVTSHRLAVEAALWKHRNPARP